MTGEEHPVDGQENCPSAATASAASSGAYVSNSTGSSSSSPEEETAELERLLTPDRLGTYQRACQGDPAQALRLYTWNISVASAFWGSFNVLEVSLRNAVHAELGALAGQEDWWHTALPLHPFEQKRVVDAQLAAQRAQGKGLQTGHVVAELSLGFWTGLLANKYHQRLWVRALHQAFPHITGKRRDLHKKLETLRKLRNRIAHHEPIFARNLAADHQRLLAVLGTISPAAVEWAKRHSRVPETIARRQAVIDGSEITTF